jgi:hypothetical protein
MNQYVTSTVRALASILLGSLILAASRGDATTAQFVQDLVSHWVVFAGAVAAPALLVLENKILGDK